MDWGLSRVLGPLVLLLSSTTLPEERGVSGVSSLCWRQSVCGGSIFGPFDALDQDVIPLLCLGCLCPLFEALWLFELNTVLCKAEGHSFREESDCCQVIDIYPGPLG